jgi:hypothetical protein
VQAPVLQVDGICAAGPGASREARGDVLDHIARDLNRDWLGDVPVGLERYPVGVLEVRSGVAH